jgi:hypothetical protein
MRYLLKMIGTNDDHCPPNYDKNYVWFPRRPRRVHKGDLMVLYAVNGQMRVFALAEVTSEVEETGNPRWPYKVDIKYSVLLPVGQGVHIDEVSGTRRNLRLSVRTHSYIELDKAEYDRAAARLRAKAS